MISGAHKSPQNTSDSDPSAPYPLEIEKQFECQSGKYINYASDNNIPELWIHKTVNLTDPKIYNNLKFKLFTIYIYSLKVLYKILVWDGYLSLSANFQN